jgi:aryl-alcohol dehydrogenase-like predicted oxidoreductase
VVDPDAIPDKTIAIMDHEMRQYHQETGLAAIPYSSQANGLFHKIEQKTIHRMDPGIRGMYHELKNRERYKRIKKLSADTSLSITQIVLGFLLSQPFTTVPIVGCKTLKQLKDSLSASEVELDPEQVRYLEYG